VIREENEPGKVGWSEGFDNALYFTSNRGERCGDGGGELQLHCLNGPDGDGHEKQPGERGKQLRRLEQVPQPDVMCAECAWKITGKTRLEYADGAGGGTVHGRINEDDRIVLPEELEEVKPSGAAVEEADSFGETFLLEILHCPDADAFVA